MALNRVGRESTKTGPAYPRAYPTTVAPIPGKVSGGSLGLGRDYALGTHLRKWAAWYLSGLLLAALVVTNALWVRTYVDRWLYADKKYELEWDLRGDRWAAIMGIVHDFRSRPIEVAAAVLQDSKRRKGGEWEFLDYGNLSFLYRNGKLVNILVLGKYGDRVPEESYVVE